jgi:type I restriction enzyme R subunit
VDVVSSEYLIRDGLGEEYKPEDYLEAFARFVRDNPAKVQAIRILLDRPKDWGTKALNELRQKLATTPERFTVDLLQKAHQLRYDKALVDIISMVKHAARDQEPLLTAQERVERAFQKLTAGKGFTSEQEPWLGRIRQHLIANLSIDQEDFENIPILADPGGWKPANRAFDGKLQKLLKSLNEAIAA